MFAAGPGCGALPRPSSGAAVGGSLLTEDGTGPEDGVVAVLSVGVRDHGGWSKLLLCPDTTSRLQALRRGFLAPPLSQSKSVVVQLFRWMKSWES